MVDYTSQFQGYGDQQAHFTQMRAAYGDMGAAMMSGGMGGPGYGATFYSGAAAGMAQMGSMLAPMTYSPPARVLPSQMGMVQQQTGFLSGLGATMGMHDTPIVTTATEYHYTAAGDFGERVGMGTATLGMTAAGTAAGAVAGMTVGRGLGAFVGAAAGSFLGPMGTVVGGAIGGFVGAEAMTLGGAAIGNAMMSPVEDRRRIQAMLESESFRYIGAGSELADHRLGRGMGSSGRMAAAEMVREMDVADPSLNTDDLTNIMQSSGRMGLFSGAGQDMESFKRRFKEITDGVKEVAKVLHTTLEEGLGVMRDLQQAGVDPSQVQQMVSRADASGMVAGMTGREMVNFGMQGAAMFRGTGVGMDIGMQSNMMNLAAVRAARDAGSLSEEAVRQAGGEQALAQRMTAGALSFTQTGMGRGFSAALFDPTTGGLNADAVQRFMTGETSLVDAYQQGARNVGSPAAMIAFEANQHKNVTELGRMYGGQGLQINEMAANISMAMQTSQDTGASVVDALRSNMLRQGKSPQEIDATVARMENAEGEFAANQEAAQTTRDKAIIDQSLRSNILYRTADRAKDWIKGKVDVVAKPANELVESMKEGAYNLHEENWKGIKRVDLSGAGTRSRFAGGGEESLVMDAGTSGLFGASAGSDLTDAIQGGVYGKEAKNYIKQVNPDQIEEYAKKHGSLIVLDRDAGKVILREDMKRLENTERTFSMSDAEIDLLHEKGKIPDKGKEFRAAMLKGDLSNAKTTADVIEATTGNTIEEVSSLERLGIMKAMRDYNFTSEMLANDRAKGSGASNAMNSSYIAKQSELKDKFDDLAEDVGDKAGVDDLTAGTFSKAINAKAIGKSLAEAKRNLAKATPGTKEHKSLKGQVAKLEEEEAAARNELTKELNNSYGLKIDDALKAQRNLIGMDGGDLEAGITLSKEIGANQQGRGAGIISTAIQQELYKSENVKALSDKQRRLITEFGTQFGGSLADLRSISGDTKEALEKTAFGRRLVKFGDLSKKIEEGGMDLKEIDDQLKEFIPNENQRSRMLSQIDQGGNAQVLESIMGNMMKDTAGDKGVAGNIQGVGQDGAVDPYKEFARQANMNATVLSILQALDQKLNKK